ncbi:MAG TPA: hypothetical protein VF240_14230 [Pyrinomonadaceae bacterium]
MKKTPLYLLLCVVLLATGCPKYRPPVNFDAKTLAGRINSHFAAKQAQYYNALGSNDPGMARRTRNELIEDALPYVDAAYEDFITGLTVGRDRTNFIADVVELGTSAAIGITNGERSIQILGVALTAFRGGRRSADLNFYKEQSTPILITKMDGNRAKVRATIIIREREGVDTYPIGAAVSDIVAYYNAGTLVRAFTELHKDTADQTKTQEDNLQVLKGVPLTMEATQVFRDLSVAASNILTGLNTGVNSADVPTKDAATTKLKKIVSVLEKNTAAAEALKNANVTSTGSDGPTLISALIDIRTAAALVNDNALLNTVNQAIVDNGQ